MEDPSELRYLDLTRCKVNKSALEEFLTLCQFLEKLSLDRLTLTMKVVNNICYKNHQTLQVLNLSRCKGLTFDTFAPICAMCLELKELNLFDTDLSRQSIGYLVNNLTENIEKLSLRSLYFVRDEHIQTLVTRCQNIRLVHL